MTNNISEMILNTVPAASDKTKTNQYQSKDNGKSFNDILDKFNKNTSNIDAGRHEFENSCCDAETRLQPK